MTRVSGISTWQSYQSISFFQEEHHEPFNKSSAPLTTTPWGHPVTAYSSVFWHSHRKAWMSKRKRNGSTYTESLVSIHQGHTPATYSFLQCSLRSLRGWAGATVRERSVLAAIPLRPSRSVVLTFHFVLREAKYFLSHGEQARRTGQEGWDGKNEQREENAMERWGMQVTKKADIWAQQIILC